MRKFFWLVAGLSFVGVPAYVLMIAVLIERQSYIDEAASADVIVILGAAEYHGRPSPVLKARLDHGLELYKRGFAPRILTTGGAGGDPIFTEGEVGRAYLMSKGVPPESIIVEREAESTAHTILAVAEIMRRMGLQSAVVVSDGYHIFRVKRMLQSRGMTVRGSPRPSQPRSGLAQWRLYIRQAIGYSLWQVGIRI
jgi:uncharacterized SAM-binding protein YcdF (DUF218 family)